VRGHDAVHVGDWQIVLEAVDEEIRGGALLSVILLLSILLGLIPLAGIVWIFRSGTISTVDGLFGTLILLSLSAIFFLNAFWELRERKLLPLGKNKGRSPNPPVAGDN